SLNVLGHRASPWGFPHFFTVDMELFGEDTFIEQLKRAPPTYIAIVHRPTPEHGRTTFGQDYARELAGWLRAHYQPIQVFGAMPFQSDAFGIMLAERRRPEADSP
ncbi:MAG: hypothetical protein QGI45_14730, partial [Myxococcota bacterium]|nr:hypothetical protein [Myxococcota bacterium]